MIIRPYDDPAPRVSPWAIIRRAYSPGVYPVAPAGCALPRVSPWAIVRRAYSPDKSGTRIRPVGALDDSQGRNPWWWTMGRNPWWWTIGAPGGFNY